MEERLVVTFIFVRCDFLVFATKLLSCNFFPPKNQRISAEVCKTRF